MSEGHPSTVTDAQTYRFISDPGHKENLSGRVRAACLTCRRKKIKCSGEPNCRTCREKGLVCEGLPERKRPRRDAPDVANHTLASRVGINRRQRIISGKRSSISQTAALSACEDFTDHNDHLTGRASTSLKDALSSTIDCKAQSGQIATRTLAQRNSSRRNSLPNQMHKDTWQVHQAPSQPQHNDRPAVPSMGGDTATSISTVSRLNQTAEPLPTVGDDRDDGTAGWWFGAGGEFVAMPPETRTRRQTVACLFPACDVADPRYQMPSGGYSFFDDSSLLANHTPAAEFTPGDFSAWLDANAPDLASMLPSTFPVDSVNAFNHPTRTSDALTIPLAQTAPNQDGHFEDYFNQGWPK
ncbi:hypothetical protein CLAFUW4_01617 [Fulvia fulva]|uniref:Zn(2)-C6 fungal-type domain-containing protein n=1 Tax=Passalora fulva TaxID=5499 RepID=A0A9Q8P3I8_PASFU|nr:uncharacterized protein CLAFUR5_01616 [Fulvia fulva]KAK4634492.1 hypothetical protein CLAFUR4_01615 [Fulvia fulva]KAK4638330.1 hypothetical protein CLAFUR0_01616 [Fulvia fulva]UJO11806.1 hypothetical protein CLAFUR5_01616 [Fulvia fulva]WPV09372.1 hypothetical protein CLAFUW4_01617 [Fulvia fulva]WPV24875.1 hypothetical protein CLAFUW7_01619 [Fulvia fulva]